MDTSRALYKITSGSPGTEVAAEAAAALSAASIAFKGVDSNYSSRLLSHSQSVRAELNIFVNLHSHKASRKISI